MIALDATTDSLEIDLTGAVTTNQLPFVAAYVDVSQTTFAITKSEGNDGTSNSTTAVTLVAAPGASTTRILKYLSVKNSDTVATELWIQLNANSTLREIWKGTLAVGDTLEYIDSNGWKVINSSGAIKNTFANTFTATRVPFAGSDGILTTDSGFTFNTTGDILTVGAINVAGTTAPTSGWYLPSADLIRTPNSVTIDDTLTVSGASATLGLSNATTVFHAISAAAGQQRQINFQTDGTNRWILIGASSSAESGSDAGSAFQLLARTDAGGAIDTVLSIVRAAGGGMSISRPVAVGGATVSSTTALIAPAGTTGVSSLRVPHGAAPSSPVNGDIWTTTSGLFVRINGSTVGPLT